MTVPDLPPSGHRPDYQRLEKVLTRSGIPDRVPFDELFIEDTMVERMTGERLSPAAEVGLYCRGIQSACMEGGGYALGTSPATCVHLENFSAMHEGGFTHGRHGTS